MRSLGSVLATAALGLLLVASCASAVKDLSLARIRNRNEALVSLFYDSSVSTEEEVVAAVKVLETAELRINGFAFFSCDVNAATNRKLAEELRLLGGMHVFVRTREDGIEEYTMPLEVAPLLRYLHLRGLVGSPSDVVPFESEDKLRALMDPDRTDRPFPLFVKFFEPWCSHCHKMKRMFEAGASFFRGRVTFLEVDCGASAAATAFCDAEGVTEYPTLVLYTPGGKFEFAGGRSLAAFELFFHEHRVHFPKSRTVPAENPVFLVDGTTSAGDDAPHSLFAYRDHEDAESVTDTMNRKTMPVRAGAGEDNAAAAAAAVNAAAAAEKARAERMKEKADAAETSARRGGKDDVDAVGRTRGMRKDAPGSDAGGSDDFIPATPKRKADKEKEKEKEKEKKVEKNVGEKAGDGKDALEARVAALETNLQSISGMMGEMLQMMKKNSEPAKSRDDL